MGKEEARYNQRSQYVTLPLAEVQRLIVLANIGRASLETEAAEPDLSLERPDLPAKTEIRMIEGAFEFRMPHLEEFIEVGYDLVLSRDDRDRLRGQLFLENVYPQLQRQVKSRVTTHPEYYLKGYAHELEKVVLRIFSDFNMLRWARVDEKKNHPGERHQLNLYQYDAEAAAPEALSLEKLHQGLLTFAEQKTDQVSVQRGIRGRILNGLERNGFLVTQEASHHGFFLPEIIDGLFEVYQDSHRDGDEAGFTTRHIEQALSGMHIRNIGDQTYQAIHQILVSHFAEAVRIYEQKAALDNDSQ